MGAGFVQDRNFFVLVLVTVVAVAGMVLGPSVGAPSMARYVLSGISGFLVTATAARIGFERARFFTFGSALGRALAFLSIGLLSYGVGDLLWLYYNLGGVEVPYPSFADVFYLVRVPLASYGLLMLLKNIELPIDLGTKRKLMLLPAAAFAVVFSFFALSRLADNVPALEKALNVAYPFGDVVVLSFSLGLLVLFRGSAMERPVRTISFGFILLALADFAFSWAVSSGAYYTGSLVDGLHLLAFFFIGLGMYVISGPYFMGALSEVGK